MKKKSCVQLFITVFISQPATQLCLETATGETKKNTARSLHKALISAYFKTAV